MPSTKRLIPRRALIVVRPRTSEESSNSTSTPVFDALGDAPVAPLAPPPPPTPPRIVNSIVSIPSSTTTPLFQAQDVVDSTTFSQTLKILNPKSWLQLWTHLNTRAHVPVFVHGPTGCGKTRGVHELVTHMGMRPVCLDAVEADDTAQLVQWVRRTREAHTLRRQSVIIIDDMEGFTPAARAELARLSKDERPHLNPMILICNARRDPLWKDFSKQCGDVRLFAPNEYTLLKWFTTCYRWTSQHDNVTRVGVSETVLRSHCGPLLTQGDVRRIQTALETCNHLGTNLSLNHDVHVQNAFDASRRLFRGTLTPEQWTVVTDARDCNLLQYHVSNLGTDRDDLANCLETFSVCDIMVPERYELSETQSHITRFIQACSIPVQLPTRSQDVGALCPPPRVARGSRLEEETLWSALRSSGR